VILIFVKITKIFLETTMESMKSGITKFVIASLLAVPALSLAQSKGSHGAFVTAAKKN
jgi:hypothetical protein